MSSRFVYSKLLATTHDLKKSLNVVPEEGMLKEGMSVPSVASRFPDAMAPLRDGILSDTIAFIVDLSPFSEFVAESTASEIRALLDYYYNGVVPVIEKCGGVVEKYIGDAIVALFGAPFGASRTTDDHIAAAFRAGQESIAKVRKIFVNELVAKVAISRGEMFLGFVGPGTHPELTAVGNPLTLLFRIEEMAERDAVILPTELYDRIESRYPDAPKGSNSVLFTAKRQSCDLRGVGRVDLTTCVFHP